MKQQHIAVGRRKEAVARVIVKTGTGNITINDRVYTEYFPLVYMQNQVELPLKKIDGIKNFDVRINVHGGGLKGQAEAIKLGIARYLVQINEEAYKPTLKEAGLLTRNHRMVERKKFGHKKARRRFQFSKR